MLIIKTYNHLHPQQKILYLSLTHSLVTTYKKPKPRNFPLDQSFRGIFCCDEKSHAGHMKAVTQSVLDGTSKWSAKIAITGLSPCHYIINLKKTK